MFPGQNRQAGRQAIRFGASLGDFGDLLCILGFSFSHDLLMRHAHAPLLKGRESRARGGGGREPNTSCSYGYPFCFASFQTGWVRFCLLGWFVLLCLGLGLLLGGDVEFTGVGGGVALVGSSDGRPAWDMGGLLIRRSSEDRL